MDRLSLRNEEQKTCDWEHTDDERNPANQLINSFSHYYKLLYNPGGAGFLPATVSGI